MHGVVGVESRGWWGSRGGGGRGQGVGLHGVVGVKSIAGEVKGMVEVKGWGWYPLTLPPWMDFY